MAEHTAFSDRQFQQGDADVFAALTRGLVGQQCWRTSRLYGDAVALDFGDPLPVANPRPKAVHKDRGSFAIVAWACDLQVRSPSTDQASSVGGAAQYVAGDLQSLVGQRVASVQIDGRDLSLVVALDKGAELRLLTSRQRSAQDQWFIQLPSRQTIIAAGDGRWSLSPDT